ncbi:protein kinase [Streptomyces mexicanus]|uniref:protein kinase n=1 Tax=Streptomyces mexicanus TaxID=178566 RepID=UPI00135B7FE1|nr:protein kinase [Streptomyces mexicanus]
MDDYAGRVLADRYRLPLPPSDEYEPTETRAFDTYSGQEVLLRQVPLPEVVEAEVLDADGLPDGLPEGFTARDGASWRLPSRAQGAAGAGAPGRRGAATRRPADPAGRRAVEAAQAAARIPDHPRLDQVFDVFTEGGSLWIASELVAARPLAALLAERPLTPYRAAEVASDLLMALRVLHGHGWVHRNITARTVLVCDDGRVMLTGLAVGAAEEALCGYDPVPDQDGEAGPQVGSDPPGGIERATGTGGDGGTGTGPYTGTFPDAGTGTDTGTGIGTDIGTGSGLAGPAAGPAAAAADPEAARRAAIEARRAAGALPLPGSRTDDGPGTFAGTAPHGGGDVRAARAGAIAAYRAGARAAARVQAAQRAAHTALPGARPPAEDETRLVPPGRIADPYGVLGTPGQGRTAPPAGQGRTAPPAEGTGVGPRQSAPPPGPAAGGGLAAPGAVPPQGAATDHGAAEQQDPGTAPHYGAAAHRGPGAAQGAAPHPGPAAAPGAVPAPARPGGPAGGPAPRGPVTALDAERARQARMTVVGPVTERWAPEQAGPVHANWQLAAPIGPATDLWALGALLFRAVQGHAPYPEESTAELVQMVCAEPPAFAEECGPLRPVVESLLRQDPTERPDVEELAGWLRSLVRSAPEPEAGAHVVSAPPPEETARLPVVRRRGELVRRRRAQLPAHHGRHKRSGRPGRSPRSLGRVLLLLILLLLAGAVAYAMLFMPKAGHDGAAGGDRTRSAGEASPAPASSGDGNGADGGAPAPGRTAPGDGNTPDRSAGSARSTGSAQTQTTGPDLAHGFALREDPAGFQVAVPKSWTRTPPDGQGQVVYSHGDFELIVVPGRDSAAEFGSDPMAYQREKESELRAYRDSSWATSSGLRTIQVGGTTMAEGQFTWNDTDGRELFVRNVAILLDGRYHVVQVRGPETQRDEVNTVYEQASATYRFTG